MRLRAALCMLCTGLLLIRAEAQHDIVSWIRKSGGVVDLEVGTVNAEGLRGTKAVRDMKKNQIAVHLPTHMAVVLGEPGQASEDHALMLLRLQKDNPEWNVSMAPYWASLPALGTSLTKHTYPEDKLGLLQDRLLEASIIVHRAYTRDMFEGSKPEKIGDFQAEFPDIEYEQFAHVTSVIASYAFLFPNEDGVMRRMLLPLLDLINHGDAERTNLDIMQADNGDFYAYALRDIAAGEELVHTYSAALQRNDQALFHYGFIQSHDPPKLAAQDLPGGNLYDVPKYTEADYTFGGALVSRKELGRLEGVLQRFPTTAEEDAQLLAGAGKGWWPWSAGGVRLEGEVERMFVRYRMLRKQALANAIGSLRAALLVSAEL